MYFYLRLIGIFNIFFFINCDFSNNQSLIKLSCESGELRTYNYLSKTKLWGPTSENVLLEAQIDVYCIGKLKFNDGYKYLVKISNIRPDISYNEKNFINRRSRSTMSENEKKSAFEKWLSETFQLIKNYIFKQSGTPNSFEFSIGTGTCHQKYETSKESKIKWMLDSETDYNKKMSLPFEFIQKLDGSVSEIRFSPKEKDERVKNFKKHIADTFATQLNPKKKEAFESSPIGQHISYYSFDPGFEKIEKDFKSADTSLLSSILSFFKPYSPLNFTRQKFQNLKVNIVRNINSDDVLKFGSGSVLIHDRNQITINAKQIQHINQGYMTNTAGFLSLNLIKDQDKKERFKYSFSRTSFNYRPKRELNIENQDLSTHMKVLSEYSINMISKKVKREAFEDKEDKLQKPFENLEYISESLLTKPLIESGDSDRLQKIREKLTNLFKSSASNFLQTFVDQRTNSYQVLLEAIEFEASHKTQFDHKNSIRSLILKLINQNEIKFFCGYGHSLDLKKCRDVLILLYKSGSLAAVDVLISAITLQSVEVVKILAENNYPSQKMVDKLLDFYEKEKNMNNNLKGLLILLISNLVSKTQKDNNLHDRFFKITEIEFKKNNCSDFLTIDLLESMGNLNEFRHIPRIIEVSKKCKSNQGHLIASIHAIRKMLTSQNVQEWLLSQLEDKNLSCSVKREIVSTLREAANGLNPNYQSEQNWPQRGFNSIDIFLDKMHSSQGPTADCLQDLILNYFLTKEDPMATVIASKLKNKVTKKRKREVTNSFWDYSDCQEWTNGNNTFDVVSDREKEELEKNDPNLEFIKRRKCTAAKHFGPKQAQIVLATDITTDILTSSNQPNYLLTAQFSISSYFLGKSIDIGKMYMYQYKKNSRAYISLFGQTLLDSKRNNCDWQTLDPYRFSTFVPLYGVNIWMINLKLGLRLRGEMMFDSTNSRCKVETDSNKVIELQPEVNLKVSGEGSSLILFVKGGIDIGTEFNYNSDLKFKAYPKLCLSAYTGFEPMNVSIESWFQIWDISCGDWSPRAVFKPTQLVWQLIGRKSIPWIQNECLLNKTS